MAMSGCQGHIKPLTLAYFLCITIEKMKNIGFSKDVPFRILPLALQSRSIIVTI